MATISFDYTIPSDGTTSGSTVSITLTYDATQAPNGNGGFVVTNATGTYTINRVDGTSRTSTITGLAPVGSYANNNNVIYPNRPDAVLDSRGVSFGISNAADGNTGNGLVNLYANGGGSYSEDTPNSNDASSFAVTCFCAGTLIRTVDGDKRVEDLVVGDVLITACGSMRPVIWIGRQSVCKYFVDPSRGHPVRIAAGALAEAVPARDLFVSPDHALLIDGVLVQAGALVNGTTIARTDPEDRFVYYHVETEGHAVILAEGTPVETFVNNVSRRRFDNYAEYVALFGARADFEAMGERDEPRAMSARQVPAAIRARIAARAAALLPADDVAA